MPQYVPLGTVAAPADWVLPPSLRLSLAALYAQFDGTNAAGGFVPTVQIISDSGHTVVEVQQDSTVAAGSSVVASWAPFLKAASASSPAATVLSYIDVGQTFIGAATGGATTFTWTGLTPGQGLRYGTAFEYGPSDASIAITKECTVLITTRAFFSRNGTNNFSDRTIEFEVWNGASWDEWGTDVVPPGVVSGQPFLSAANATPNSEYTALWTRITWAATLDNSGASALPILVRPFLLINNPGATMTYQLSMSILEVTGPATAY